MRLNRHLATALSPLLLLSASVHAEVDLGSLELFAKDNDTSPIPKGLILGGAVISGTARYEAQKDETYVIPGALYFGDQFMYLGDRGRYYFHLDDNTAAYAYGRFRFGNLDPDDEDAFDGMHKRKSEFEAGVGGTIITPYALLSARVSSDVTGRSNGQELLLWADFPIVKGNLLVMPGMGMMIRSDKMANYYFGGVSKSEATAQRPEWDTGTTFSPMAAVITSYRFSPKWVGMLAANYEFYDKDIADSPIVQHNGELYGILAVGYIW
ncbi:MULTISPECIES: MipA/OmpV family protein [Buttiauxella]|uniref:MipA/OmpV family protein n=1 Tax=Buttiauxella TaxID=82976 RepID=UPI0007E3B4A4|nr:MULTISPECIES: MipA/OmpV family protein [Buttiauxella]MCE0825440.1 MipA/OmpV family protein [Buttiauxella ferragutiae]UNK62574.1 MipA/OmpV family protein [Buttiauxella ferragutiae]